MAYLFAQADALRLPLADRSVAVAIGSPPYCDARTYGIGADRGCDEWIEWMLAVTSEALRVSRNCVIWVASGVTRDRNYWTACEGLMDRWRRRLVPSGVWQDGIELPGEAGSCYRPAYWHRVGIPGSGHDDWFRADVEMCMCFKRPGRLPFADNTACGHPPKWAPGGEMSNRLSDGTRINQWGKTGRETGTVQMAGGVVRHGGIRPSHATMTKSHTKRMKGVNHESGTDMEVQHYTPPVIANPGTLLAVDEETAACPPAPISLADLLDYGRDLGPSVLHTTTGGGQLGWAGAHANEAPFPEKVPEFFVKSLTQAGDIVVDPFSGSGTTSRVANRLGRRFVGFDIRHDQCRLGVQGLERPHKPIVKPSRLAGKPSPLLDLIAD